ncbi:hypothetical protein FC85_GL002421 [Lentilactobacillus diolivorans DSM 14421]|uniref:Uncharacterized protein n=1 Tax=Lentilactobacillus diolivorans DSM 14421 TaxID=1423739 RepID=A0A0R1STP8_9LACO|nr:hypothetical protein FC85_GL002421 [Lentilactobacillus diolivorans DSM 14421]
MLQNCSNDFGLNIELISISDSNLLIIGLKNWGGSRYRADDHTQRNDQDFCGFENY